MGTSQKYISKRINELKYRDDYFDRKNIGIGYGYNTTYMGKEIKDNSSKPSAPQFSFGKTPKDLISSMDLTVYSQKQGRKSKARPYSNQWTKVMKRKKKSKGRYPPHVSTNVFKNMSPRATIGNDKRFKKIYKGYRKNKKIPHSYLTNLREILGSKSNASSMNIQQTLANPTKIGPAISIPKSSRFNTFQNTGPGPGDYTRPTTSQHKSRKNKQRLKNTQLMFNTIGPTFGHPHKTSSKIYFEEYEKDMSNKFGPGPAYYNMVSSFQSIKKSTPRHKFSKSKRFNMLQSSSVSPSRPDLDKITKKSIRQQSFGRTPRNFDPRKMNNLTCKLWSKGVTR